MTLLSLFPGLLEEGLAESSCIVPEDTPEHTPEHSIVDPALEVDIKVEGGVVESSCIVPEDTPKQTPEHSKVEPPSLEIYIEIEGGGGGRRVLL